MDNISLYELLSEWGCHLGCQESLQLLEEASLPPIHPEASVDENA